jgi:hypothetical protein
LAVAVACTIPGPEPVAPLDTANQLASLDADHEQPAAVVTVMADPPPAAGYEPCVGDRVKVQPDACTMLNDRPEMLRVVERSAPSLAATLNWTAPGPVPAPPAVIVTQSALLVADHAQPAGAVTATEPALAPDGTALDEAPRLY